MKKLKLKIALFSLILLPLISCMESNLNKIEELSYPSDYGNFKLQTISGRVFVPSYEYVNFSKKGSVKASTNVSGYTYLRNAEITITNSEYRAVTDIYGDYEIKNVPAGKYDLILKHNDIPTFERKIVVYEDKNLNFDVFINKNNIIQSVIDKWQNNFLLKNKSAIVDLYAENCMFYSHRRAEPYRGKSGVEVIIGEYMSNLSYLDVTVSITSISQGDHPITINVNHSLKGKAESTMFEGPVYREYGSGYFKLQKINGEYKITETVLNEIKSENIETNKARILSVLNKYAYFYTIKDFGSLLSLFDHTDRDYEDFRKHIWDEFNSKDDISHKFSAPSTVVDYQNAYSYLTFYKDYINTSNQKVVSETNKVKVQFRTIGGEWKIVPFGITPN